MYNIYLCYSIGLLAWYILCMINWKNIGKEKEQLKNARYILIDLAKKNTLDILTDDQIRGILRARRRGIFYEIIIPGALILWLIALSFTPYKMVVLLYIGIQTLFRVSYVLRVNNPPKVLLYNSLINAIFIGSVLYTLAREAGL